MFWYSNWIIFRKLFLILPTYRNCSVNRFLSWPLNCNCLNSLSVVWYILIGMVRTIDWCSDFPICFWSCLLIGMVLAIGVCPGLPIDFFFVNMFRVLSINGNGSHNRFMLWPSHWNCYCVNNLLLVLALNKNGSVNMFLCWPLECITVFSFIMLTSVLTFRKNHGRNSDQ